MTMCFGAGMTMLFGSGMTMLFGSGMTMCFGLGCFSEINPKVFLRTLGLRVMFSGLFLFVLPAEEEDY